MIFARTTGVYITGTDPNFIRLRIVNSVAFLKIIWECFFRYNNNKALPSILNIISTAGRIKSTLFRNLQGMDF